MSGIGNLGAKAGPRASRGEDSAVQRKRPPSRANNVRSLVRVHGAILAGPRLSTCAFASPLEGGSTRVPRRGSFCNELTLYFAMNYFIERGREDPKGSPVLEVCGGCLLSVGPSTGSTRPPACHLYIDVGSRGSPARILRGARVSCRSKR